MTYWITKGNHCNRSKYHTDKDCPYLKQANAAVETTKKRIEWQNRDLCKLCADNEDNEGKNSGTWAERTQRLKQTGTLNE